MRSGPARRWVQAHSEVRNTGGKRWLRFFNGKRILRDMLSEEFREWDVDKFADALVLRSLRAVRQESGDCQCGSKRKTSILSVSHVLGGGQFRIPQRICTQLYGIMCGILESIHQIRAPPAQWAELEVTLERQCVMETFSWPTTEKPTNKAWCVYRHELFFYLTSQLLQDKHTRTFRPGLRERDVCTLLLTKSILGLPCWLRAGYKGIGEVRPACLFPLVKSKCFLDSGVRRCCKVGHSCMRRVIDCSSVPHNMAWRSLARAIRTIARLGGPGCEIFDISQLRFELDSMFQELDTSPSRCCWRCGCSITGISLITADVDQALEACSVHQKPKN